MKLNLNGVALTDAVAAQIIEYIQEHELAPGDKLPTEQELVEMFQVSRSTLREAFKTLVSRNILETRQGSGTYVSPKRGIPTDPLGLTFMQTGSLLALDLLELRLILEPELAALAAVRRSPCQLARIEAACVATEQDIRADRPHDYNDLLLHREIAAASGNKIAPNLIDIIYSSIRQNINITDGSLREHTRVYHRRMVESIKEQDMQGARYAVIVHLSENRRYIMMEAGAHETPQ